MEAYPSNYTAHNLPLLVLSGLGEQDNAQTSSQPPRQESGSRVVLKSTECDPSRARPLLDQFLEYDGSQSPQNATALPGPAGTIKYRIKRIGRTLALPPRKAAPLAQAPGEGGAVSNNALHSPLSPLSPGSPIFPDGIFTPLWMGKHEDKIPAMLLAFFDLSAGGDSSQNEKIQMDINAIRTTISRSGHKTKFAVVLISNESILDAPEIEERLSAIRRATTLDPKTGLFFMPPMSSDAEIASFVENLLTTIQPLCIEYYRDLTKHARRKKARGGPPASITSPIAGSSLTLSAAGWNVRYDVKQGIFAEFRQEMDVAERHYSGAIDELFNPSGALEMVDTWSPRWHEARMLSDAVAIRVIRCQLWNSLTTGAVIYWLNYRARTKSLIERRGKGSETYSWAAWESRWAEIMALMIGQAQLPALESHETAASSLEPEQQKFFAQPERVMERLPPFQFLHHPGYWQQLALGAHRLRRQRAAMLSERHRTPPAQLPASEVSKIANEHDLYLVPYPHKEYPLAGEQESDHVAHLDRLSREAITEFDRRNQPRSSAHVQLDLAKAYIDDGRQAEAMNVLKPLWQDSLWRADEWHDLLSSVLSLIIPCAAHRKDAEVLVAATWEALGTKTASDESLIDFSQCLESVGSGSQKISVKAEDKQLLSPIKLAFAFGDKEGFVGEPLECQLTVTSCAPTGSAPLTLSGIQVSIGERQVVQIKHESAENTLTIALDVVDISDSVSSEEDKVETTAPLVFSPGQARVYSFLLHFREAEEVEVRSVSLSIQTPNLDFEHIFTHEHIVPARSLCYGQNDLVQEKLLRHPSTTAVSVLPKPPKVEVQLDGTNHQYYTDEAVRLTVTLVNGEAEDVHGVANAVVNSPSGEEVEVEWLDAASNSIPKLSLSNLGPAGSVIASILFHAPPVPTSLTLGIEVAYTLASDESAQLVKTLRLDMDFVMGFEAKFDVGPWLSPDTWPSYFDMPLSGEKVDEPEGIPHRWLLRSKIRSLAAEQLLIRELELSLDEEPTDTKCLLQKFQHTKKQVLEPHAIVKSEYEFTTRKFSFDDRRASSADLSLKVVWSRNESSEPCTTVLSIPRLTLPSSEPRVLCSRGEAFAEHEMILLYHLENPSAHFLTFAVTLEANDEFGFSGSKFRTLSLAPLSRYRLEYHLVIHDEDDTKGTRSGDRYIWPALQVLDSYYQKNLKVHPGGPGVKLHETTAAIGVLVKG